MCIIIAKKKEDRLPTKEELKNCFTINRDGAGFMYVDDGYVHIDKGYMTYDAFEKRFDALCKKYNDFKNKSLVIHCRIGTSSGNIPENTHPYPITSKEEYLHALKVKCSLGMAHNGIIPGYTPTWANPTTNDTQEFVMKFVYELRKRWNDFYKNEKMLSALGRITNSRLAFLDTDDNVYLVGDWVTEKGLKFSNSTFRTYTYNYTGGKYSCADYFEKPYYSKTFKNETKLEDVKTYDMEEYEDFAKKTPTTNSDSVYTTFGALGADEMDSEDVVKLKGGDLIYVSTQVGWRKVGILDDLYYNVNDGNVYRYSKYYNQYKLLYENVFAYNKDFELYDDICNTILNKVDSESGAGALV